MKNSYFNNIEEIFSKSKNFNHAVDVGANIGEMTKFLSSRWNCVTAFEPAPDTFKELSKNVDSNGECINCGISDTNGKLNFAIGKNSRINQFVSPGYQKKHWHTETVPVKTLDSFNFKELDLLKIDVEGHERQAVLGAENTIKKLKPIIIIEISFEKKILDKDISKDHSSALTILESWGYEIIQRHNHDYILSPMSSD